MKLFRRNSLGNKLNSILILFIILVAGCVYQSKNKAELRLGESDYFETQGLNILVFSNMYNENFGDSKMSGVEVIHHDVRTVTNGDVRLSSTPGQWDPIPVMINRKVNKEKNCIEAILFYPEYDFKYKIRVQSRANGVLISVDLDTALPRALEGKAGFNLEFLPSVYMEKSYLMDKNTGIFPLYPGGPMENTENGFIEPKPIAYGKRITLAPEDPKNKITIQSLNGDLLLFDGRNTAHNGWYVVRTLIPVGKTGEVISWHLTANTIPGWVRTPVIGHSQIGYAPNQKKVAVIEIDRLAKHFRRASIFKLITGERDSIVYTGSVKEWGNYLRYAYYTFDFSEVKDSGLFVIEYGNVRSKPFRISIDVFAKTWEPTLDVFLPVQMDHMFVNEAYRVWHGASHLDDALQAPLNHKHFDLFAQGPVTDSPYEPGEHIPGLNIGGWFDAGDFDVRTQSQYATVLSLVHTWELFHPARDETTIDQKNRYVDIHHPDGKPDILQQIEHGTLALIVQYRAVGHAISGIVESHLSQYTHLGDAITKTDNLIYKSSLDSLEQVGNYSGTFDDRWAFTSRSTPLNYGSAAALAAASRALRDYNRTLSEECLFTALKVWDDEHSHEPYLFRSGNTTGGMLEEEELKAAVELLLTTKDQRFTKRIIELWPVIDSLFNRNASLAVRTLPYLDNSYREKVKIKTLAYKDSIDKLTAINPYGLPIYTGGWAGNGLIIFVGITNYWLYSAFPDIIDKEYVFNSLNYIYGCHPGSDISFVSGVGSCSKKVAYGNNRADFSFIAGGVVPGVLILPPDFPENKEDWPFLWGENEYVIGLGAAYIFLAQASNDIVKKSESNTVSESY